jgi:uncharacterized membrane protein
LSLRALRGLGFALLLSMAVWPLLPLLARRVPALTPLSTALEPWFHFHCEGDPERSLRWGGALLAVCARCSGIYFGLGLGALVRRPRLRSTAFRVWMLGAAGLMLLDVAAERWGAHGAWPLVRVGTGLLLAYPLGVGLGVLLTRAPRH